MQANSSRMVRSGRAVLLGLSALLVGACATEYPAAPTSAATPDYNYIIGPGDSIYYNSVVPHNLSAAGDGSASIYAVLYFPE